ncbi:COP1-interactive protein 1-like [Andrographis paniculata]|uniref:COP1-interactive protein 1-like n=1 Tax=Andrographis paniculata TaxID=175694 RepID=UPI0021E87C4F|nr:COP1-interactive protein 1-like [Andrographis paniculata]
MTKNRLEGSLKSIRNHLDPEKEEHLKWMKTELENKVGKLISLARRTSDSKDGDSKRQSELVNLIEDVHRQYELLHSLHENLRVEVKNNFRGRDGSESPTSASDSESYFSPDESSVFRNTDAPNTPTDDNQSAETSDADYTILKDKLTSSSKVKETTGLGPQSAVVAEMLKEHAVRDDESESPRPWATQVKELKEEVARLKAENEKLFGQKQQLEDALKLRKDGELEEQWLHEGNERSSHLNGLVEQLDSLQKELLSVNSEKAKLEFQLEKKSTEASDYLIKIDSLRRELKDHAKNVEGRVEEKESSELDHVKDLDQKLDSLSSKKLELEEQLGKASQSEAENQELRRRVFDLQASLSDRENVLSAQRKKFEECCAQIESLNEELRKQEKTLKGLDAERENLQNEKRQYKMELEQEKQKASQWEKANTELTNKVADQQKTMLELGEAVNKMRGERERGWGWGWGSDPKTNLQQVQAVERKMEETAEEMRKELEAKYRIVSRRIRVAEQVQAESREWWERGREERRREMKEWAEGVKRTGLEAKEVAARVERVGLRFEERTGNFLNRISKAACEVKYMREWAMRKNRAVAQGRREAEWAAGEMDEKEGEILALRERVWRAENRARELEKAMKKKEERMVGLEEEKREAIRQLCVWIDYHRSRSDYYKKMLSELIVYHPGATNSSRSGGGGSPAPAASTPGAPHAAPRRRRQDY